MLILKRFITILYLLFRESFKVKFQFTSWGSMQKTKPNRYTNKRTYPSSPGQQSPVERFPPPLSNPLELDIVSLVLVSSISEFCVTTGADLDRPRCRLRRVLASFEGFGRLFFYVCFVNFFAFLSLLKFCLETKLVSLSSWGVILQILS